MPSFIPCCHKISSGLPKVGVLSCECRTERRCRVGVDQWNCIIGCVSVGHGNIQRPVLSHVITRFPPVCRKWEF